MDYKELEGQSPSKASAARTIFETFNLLKAEGPLPAREVLQRLRTTLEFTDWEKAILEKTGYVRWESFLHYYSVDCAKAGFLRKDKGIWYITKEGEEEMKKGPLGLINAATAAYRKWAKDKKLNENQSETAGVDPDQNIEQIQKANIEQLQEQAIDGIKQFIIQKNPYDFQDIVAALLRAMGYYTPFVSPKGKDGGIDIIAYQDPLGIKTPRIKVQVKHYPENPVGPDTVRSLKGLINSGEEVGLFVTSGRFTTEAERFAREANVHIKLINGEDFITLWQEFYGKMPDEDKMLLPLQSIYFLGSNE